MKSELTTRWVGIFKVKRLAIGARNLVILDLPEVSRLTSEKRAKRTDKPVFQPLLITLFIVLVSGAEVRIILGVFRSLSRRNRKVAIVMVDERRQVVTVMFGPHLGHCLIFTSIVFFVLGSYAVIFSAFLPLSGIRVTCCLYTTRENGLTFCLPGLT